MCAKAKLMHYTTKLMIIHNNNNRTKNYDCFGIYVHHVDQVFNYGSCTYSYNNYIVLLMVILLSCYEWVMSINLQFVVFKEIQYQ